MLSNNDVIEDIDAELTRLEPKERRNNRKSLGVNNTIIKRLSELYKGLKDEYLANYGKE